MRLRSLAVILVTLLLWAPDSGICASSVLVPSGSAAPNLGLTPSEPAPADSAPSSTTNNNNASDNTGSAKPVLPPLDSAPLPYTPAPVIPNRILPMPSVPATPTMVVKEPDPSTAAPPAPGSPQPAYSLTVGLAVKSVLGALDIGQVNDRLGIDKSKVASLCRLVLGGVLMTDKEPVAFESGSSPRADVRYDGAIASANIHVEALCDMVPVPPNKGVVIQMGNKYLVPLGSVMCPAPAPGQSIKQLAVLYSGNSTGECRFE